MIPPNKTKQENKLYEKVQPTLFGFPTFSNNVEWNPTRLLVHNTCYVGFLSHLDTKFMSTTLGTFVPSVASG